MYRQLTTLIHEHRTWIDVLDSVHEGTFMIQAGGDLHPIHCRVLELVVTVYNGVYPRGHVWSIPEYKLDKAVYSLKRDVAFSSRYGSGTITIKDAETIIRHASHKFIDLELE